MGESLFVELRAEVGEYLKAGVSVALTGLPGSGRSRLLRAVADQLVTDGWEALEIHGSPALTTRPLEALALAGLLDARSQGAGTPVSSAVVALRRAVTRDRTFLVIDDADQLDETSAGAIVAALHGGRIPVLSATSIARATPDFSIVAHVRPNVRVAMPPLAFHDSSELIDEVAGGPVAVATAARIHAKSGGLPGIIEVLVENAVREGLLVRRDGVWAGAATMWSPRLAAVIETFLQGLAPTEFDALAILSLVGTIDAGVARRLTAWSEVERLDERGLLAFGTEGDSLTVSVYPPLLSEHLRRDRLGARRLRLLADIDATLNGTEAQDLGRTRLTPGALDSPVAPVSLAAARGFGTPVAADPENRHSLDATLNRMVYERVTAETLVRRAEWNRHPDASSAISYALALMSTDAPPAEIARILEVPDDETDERQRATLATWRGFAVAVGPEGLAGVERDFEEERRRTGKWSRLLDITEGHLRFLGEGVGGIEPEPEEDEPATIRGAARLLRAEQLLALGRPAQALAEIDIMEREDTSVGGWGGALRILATVFQGDLDASEVAARDAFDGGIASLDPEAITPYGYVLAAILALRGDDAPLRDHIGTVLSVGYTPLRYAHYHLGTLAMAVRIAASMGREANAASLADEASAMVPPLGPFPLMSAVHARSHAALVAGAPSDQIAKDLWEGAVDAAGRGYLVSALVHGIRSLEVDPDVAHAREMAIWQAACEPGGLPELIMRYADGLVGTNTADMLDAADFLDASGCAGFAIRVRVAAAALASRTGDADGAAIARELRARAEELGGEYPALVKPLLQGSVLTAREREIAQLAADGMSNGDIAKRLVVSTRTVENHLYRVFQKLHIDGRQQLAATLDA
ncbi:helix-turn-helix transcriptional regulator [Microbacterium suaedae]|uniref:helix-turn-helix transcriptional regulator n=1 Tax=Microbacterium suaedae TaxID=2067813 RepID=UPI0013A646A2|nr:helix-turn-helix transcriptional regulator [Microbacterium suaedae]